MTPADDVRKPTLRQQIDACMTAAHQAEEGARDAGMSTGGFAANLYAAAATLRTLQEYRAKCFPHGMRYSAECLDCQDERP